MSLISRNKLKGYFELLGGAPDGSTPSSEIGLSDENLRELIESAAIASDVHLGEVVIPRRLRRLSVEYGKQVRRELRLWARQHRQWLAIAQDGDDLFSDDGPYAVLMTLRAEEAGDVGDGRWDTHFRKSDLKRAIPSLRKAIVERLRRWSNEARRGVLDDAIREAVEESSYASQLARPAAPVRDEFALERRRRPSRPKDDDDDNEDEDEDEDDDD